MTNKPGQRYRVKASVQEWKSGRYGTWAAAQIHSEAPTTSAIFGVNKLGAQPAPGENFECEIAEEGGRWRVVAMITDELPLILEPFIAIVDEQSGSGRAKGYSLMPLDPSITSGLRTWLPQSLLDNANIARLVVNSHVVVSAKKVTSGYEADGLQSPHAGMAFPDWQSSGASPSQPVIALALQDWSRDRPAKAVLFAVRAPDAQVYASVWIDAKALRAVGIRALHRATLPEIQTEVESIKCIEQWTEVLRTGTTEAINALHIDRVSVLIESAKEGKAWKFHHLLAPRALREPHKDGEVVDWVRGDILSIKEKNGEEDTRIISIAFADHRLGRGEGRAFLPASVVTVAELDTNVPVIIRLISRQPYWNISHVHRATPALRAHDDDSQPAQ